MQPPDVIRVPGWTGTHLLPGNRHGFDKHGFGTHGLPKYPYKKLVRILFNTNLALKIVKLNLPEHMYMYNRIEWASIVHQSRMGSGYMDQHLFFYSFILI